MVNQDQIAADFCVNKSEPEKKCNGKCYLKKQLKQTEGNHNDHKGNIQLEETNIVALLPASKMISETIYVCFQDLVDGYKSGKVNQFSNDIFRPPC